MLKFTDLHRQAHCLVLKEKEPRWGSSWFGHLRHTSLLGWLMIDFIRSDVAAAGVAAIELWRGACAKRLGGSGLLALLRLGAES